MEAHVEIVGVLVSSEINKEQVQAIVDVGETSMANVSRIEIDLQKTITMIVKQKIVGPLSMSKQDNEDEHVTTHADIDTSDILNLIYYNVLAHPSSQVKRMREVFFVNFVISTSSLIIIFRPLPHLPSPCEKVHGAFFGVRIYR